MPKHYSNLLWQSQHNLSHIEMNLLGYIQTKQRHYPASKSINTIWLSNPNSNSIILIQRVFFHFTFETDTGIAIWSPTLTDIEVGMLTEGAWV